VEQLIHYLQKNTDPAVTEIIVSDGGSTDNTIEKAVLAGATVIVAPQKGRASQMNFAAGKANADILYFVHADTFPPVTFAADIFNAVQNGFSCGRYQTKFNSPKWLLKVNAFFTRFDWFICYGGDQTFFVTKKLFDDLEGFDASMTIMEEYDFTARAKQKSRYKIFNKSALVSARKYEGRSWWQVQMANRRAIQLLKKGASQQQIVTAYKAMLR
jgi:rSAM/selenodomain-associated transferase 2